MTTARGLVVVASSVVVTTHSRRRCCRPAAVTRSVVSRDVVRRMESMSGTDNFDRGHDAAEVLKKKGEEEPQAKGREFFGSVEGEIGQ